MRAAAAGSRHGRTVAPRDDDLVERTREVLNEDEAYPGEQEEGPSAAPRRRPSAGAAGDGGPLLSELNAAYSGSASLPSSAYLGPVELRFFEGVHAAEHPCLFLVLTLLQCSAT